MSNKPKMEYRVGVGASSILMVLVVLALTAVSLLSFRSARNTEVLTQRNTDMTVAYYEASARAQQKLAAMDALLAEGQEEALAILGEPVSDEADSQAAVALDETSLMEKLSSVGMAELRLWEENGNWMFSFREDAAYDRYIQVEGTLTPTEASRYQLLRYRLFSEPAEDEPMEFQLMGG